MIRIAVVEDNEIDKSLLKECIDKYSAERGVEFDIRYFGDGIDFIEDFRGGMFDIVFMDIELPRYDGMSAAERLRQTDKEVRLVFVTNSAKYAIKGYEVDAMYYFLKPLKYFSFAAKLDKIVLSLQKYRETVTIKTLNRGIARVAIDDIFYIEVFGNRLTYHTKSGEYEERKPMKAVEGALSQYGFSRCNNYCLVNLRYVSEAKQNTVIVNNVEFDISRSRKKLFLNELTAFAWRIN